MAQSTSPFKDQPAEVEEGEEGLETELVQLRQQVCEQDGHITVLEEEVARSSARNADLERQVITWREKYDRLYDSHKRVQKVNQNLEDKLLQMADKCTADKSQLARDVETLSVRLAESNYSMGSLHKENERYKNDMNLAIQLLQCKPDNFVSQKFDTLPVETQARVSSYIMSRAKLNPESPTGLSAKTIPTTPEKINPEEFEFNISASLMSKILEESVHNTISKHCDTCTCPKNSSNPFSYGESHYTVSTQTAQWSDSLCNKCNSEMNSTKSVILPLCHSSPVAKPPAGLEGGGKTAGSPPPVSPKPNILECNTNDIIYDKCLTSETTIVDINNITKPQEESSKLVSLKHKEIMEKIGENLNEMNLKNEFQITAAEPAVAASGHHRLCHRTKPVTPLSKTATEYFYGKTEEEPKGIDIVIDKPVAPSPKLVSTIQMADDSDITFAQIERPILIPNLSECKNNFLPKSKADLNFIDNANNLRNNSISSNEAESKTSSSRSWKNNGSHNSSNAKVHIGPGPRFCSLRMQAGSKNILLDNAQPNIAPVLYTRQSRNFDTSPSPIGALCDDDIGTTQKRDNPQSFYGPSFLGSANVNNLFSNHSATEEIAILDLPNEELPLSKPIEICEKPESGYKSNESAEIIDKLLFGVDPTVPVSSTGNAEVVNATDNISKEKETQISEPNNETVNVNISQSFDGNVKFDHFQRERRASIHNMKVFNFDQYERNLKIQPISKVTKENKIISPHFHNYGNTKVPGTARQVINDIAKDIVDGPQINTNDLNKMAQKTVNQITKKIVRNIANQTLPENLPGDILKDWKKETSTEKSSSSLSSDDSAAVLQKQQLIRVAQWVQQNLEMEHQGDPAGQQTVEELHHVRNDFPRPAKVEHRPRKAALKPGHKPSHHPSHKHTITKHEDPPNPPPEEVKVSMVMTGGQWEGAQCPSSQYSATTSHITTRSYSREELARMEYNVKQFLLNGSRWTPDPPKDRRTSSKTETDFWLKRNESRLNTVEMISLRHAASPSMIRVHHQD